MRTSLPAFVLSIGLICGSPALAHEPVQTVPLDPVPVSPPVEQRTIENPIIDMNGFLKVAVEAAKYREGRRVSEEQFLNMSKEEGTIILDTRSAAMYKLLHIEGAVHLNFSDITTAGLTKAIPDKNTRILIYCNNNFKNRPVAFRGKSAPAALNIPTFITLYQYGYRNLYELGPLLDADTTILPLVSRSETTGDATGDNPAGRDVRTRADVLQLWQQPPFAIPAHAGDE